MPTIVLVGACMKLARSACEILGDICCLFMLVGKLENDSLLKPWNDEPDESENGAHPS